jgi:hypothetical protein
VFLFGLHRLLEQPLLLDDAARRLLLFLQGAFNDQTLQPCLGLRVETSSAVATSASFIEVDKSIWIEARTAEKSNSAGDISIAVAPWCRLLALQRLRRLEALRIYDERLRI